MYKIWRYKNGDDLLKQGYHQEDASPNTERARAYQTQAFEDPEIERLISRTNLNSGLMREAPDTDRKDPGVNYLINSGSSQSSRQAQDGDWWQFVDKTLMVAISNYESIKKVNVHGRTQPIFIDLIIKLKICRAYALNKN